uniref:Uncharacterized protein n=1 Tax=Anopheles maculatus TaxID=74869 RepID=A0A182S5I1_9DIPT
MLSSLIGRVSSTIRKFTSNVRGSSAIFTASPEGMEASTSYTTKQQNEQQRRSSMMLPRRITSSNLDVPLFKRQPPAVASSSSSASCIIPSSSVASASSSGSAFGTTQRFTAETSSLDEEKMMLLSSVGDALYAETGTDTDDSGLPTRPPSHTDPYQFDSFPSPFDNERLIVEKSSSEKMLQTNVLDGVYQYALRRGSSDDRLPSCPPSDSGRGSTEKTT